jgi:hypothetical protein
VVRFTKTLAAVSGATLLAFAGFGVAQNPGLTRTIVAEADVSVPDREAFVIPAGVMHNAKNVGATAIKLVGVYVVEKGKPLASPAPAPAQ